jgi:hypothetical protein
MAVWFMPRRIVLALPGAVWFAILAGSLALALALVLGNHVRAKRSAETSILLPWLLFLSIYTCVIVMSGTMTNIDALGSRLLAPLFAPVVCVILARVHGVWTAGRPQSEGGPAVTARFTARVLCVLFILGWVALSAFRASDRIQEMNSDRGGDGYASKRWRESATAAYLRRHTPSSPILSNSPDALYILTGQMASLSPRKVLNSSTSNVGDAELARVDALLQDKGRVRLVWFEPNSRDYLYSREELAEKYELRPAALLSDGGLYLVAAKR